MADLLTILGDQGVPGGFLVVAAWFGRTVITVARQLADRVGAAFERVLEASTAHTAAVHDLAASVRGSSVSAPPLAALEDDDPRPAAIG